MNERSYAKGVCTSTNLKCLFYGCELIAKQGSVELVS